MKYDYKKITLEDMKNYIEQNAPQDKEWFKSVAIRPKKVKAKNKKTKEVIEKEVITYDHFKAREEFCKRYMPEIIPVAKKKEPNKSDILANW